MTDFQGTFYRDVQPFSGGWTFLLGGLPGSLPAPRTRQTLPRNTVGVGRVQNGAHGLKTRRHLLRQHTIPSFFGYTRGGGAPDFRHFANVCIVKFEQKHENV